ncbi:OB-fold domain-containing protein [Halobellus sp. GM3]|uniref:OB-fold domain-containing protein n=1 Tax=Halobellus sp. GM3 TaxID=3458410 RepID=UPI00403D7064
MSDIEHASHGEWLEAIAANDAFALVCPNGHTWLPPRRACSRCGATDFDRRPLPDKGSIETYTEICVLPPRYEYRDAVGVAIAEFGGVRITGRLSDGAFESLEPGTPVELSIGDVGTTDEQTVVFCPPSRNR